MISIPELDQHDQEVGNIEIDYATTSVVAVSMMLPGLQQALLLRDEDSSWFQLTGTDLFGFDHLGNAHPSTRHSPCDADMVFSWLERCCIFASRVWPELLSAYPALRSFNTLAIENKILDRDGWHPKHGQENGFAYRGCSAIPVKAKEQELLSDVESVARKLIGNGPAIFRYLANNPKGVSFGEFMCASNPVTGLRLTTSEQPANIANMLKRLSREQLKQHTYEITAKPQANLIKLRKIGR